MISAIIIAVASVPIVWVSRRSLLKPASHGFARFFAFEAILVLVVLNGPHWFDDPLAVSQVLSWLLLAASLVSLIWGTTLLRRLGQPQPTTEDSSLYGWENTRSLVTHGIYRYIRHPMYASLLLLGWGAVFKSVGLVAILLGLVATVALFCTAKAEERENLVSFGDAYRKYMEHTHRFVPYLF